MTTHQDTSNERERFESWYFENVNRAELPDWLPTLKTYSSATVANLWCAWQAALASRDEAAQQPQGQAAPSPLTCFSSEQPPLPNHFNPLAHEQTK